MAKVGRKKGVSNRDRIIAFRVSVGEYDKLKKWANKRVLSPAKWARFLTLTFMESEVAVAPKQRETKSPLA